MRNLVLFIALAAAALGQVANFDELFRLARTKSPEATAALAKAMPADAVKKGTAWLAKGPDFVFAIETAITPKLVVDDGQESAMTRGDGNFWYTTMRLGTGRTHNFNYLIGGAPFGGRTDVIAYGPMSYERSGIPKGVLSGKMQHSSKIYEGMVADYWTYVPAQYDASKPVAVMFWTDGEVLMPRLEPSRAQVVFDNLTHDKKIPVIIHVLVSPGKIGARALRSVQYDTVTDTFAKYVLDEILAEVGKKYNLRKDGYSRAIAGDSSGGICAFNSAWWKPEEFSRVLSRIGSFTSIQWKPGQLDGGNVIPFAVRKQEKRNIRVWMQDGSGDLENEHGSWPAQNINLANSLKMKGYDFHFTWGNGTHSRNGGHAELAEEMIWLWRDYDPGKTTQVFEQDPAEKMKPPFRVKALNREQ